MKNRHLFLIGSGPPMPEKLAESFASLLEKGPVVLLYKPRKDMSIQEYSSVFTDPITSHSPDIPFHFIKIKESYEADEVKKLKSAGGLMIGGGDTVKYQQYIAESELAPIIRTLYTAGIPIAGFSAGALIVPDMCVISAKDNEQERTLYKKGLGLVKNRALAVHYLSWREQNHLRKTVNELNVSVGYGIDERSGIYLENETVKATEGYVYFENSSS